MIKKVLVLAPAMGVEHMFSSNPNFEVISDIKADPDLICFTGGSDVSPSFYNEEPLPCTYTNITRDNHEKLVFERFKQTPKVGICRGGQFLNVMNGGSMWQDVSNHGRNHLIVNLLKTKTLKDEEVMVTSTHHQMMIPNLDEGVEIAIAFHSESKSRGLSDTYKSPVKRDPPRWDTEVVWYEKNKSLCFQPHPEYSNLPKNTEYFFNLLDHFYFS